MKKGNLTDDEREAKEKELDLIKRQMAAIHEELANLRKTQKSPLAPSWTGVLFLVVLFLYLMYRMYTNPVQSPFGDANSEADADGASVGTHEEVIQADDEWQW